MNAKKIDSIIGNIIKFADAASPSIRDFVELHNIGAQRTLDRQCIMAAFAGLIAHDLNAKGSMSSAAREAVAIKLGRSLAKTLKRMEEEEDAPLHEAIHRSVTKAQKKHNSKPSRRR